ncbi:MgtC/SapB family protein [Shimazuella alba]|nr:MgtC/SapB family protein [Shimazuella alba]
MVDILHPSYWVLTERLFMAALMGGLIGWERELNHSPAGFRTHILVSVGSALIMLISIYGFADFVELKHFTFDPSRISAQVVSGIGFLGAGTILRQGVTVSGLTTAASLWVVAAIGLSTGAGYYFPAIITTIIVFVGLIIRKQLDRIFWNKKTRAVLEVWTDNEVVQLSELITIIANSKSVSIKKLRIEEDQHEESKITFTIKIKGESLDAKLLEELQQVEGINRVEQVY